MSLIDSHVHLKAIPIGNRVSSALLVSIDHREWEMVSDVSIKYAPQITPAFGIHPWFASKVIPPGLDSTAKYLDSFELQKEMCFSQFNLANQLKRPISLHLVGGESVSVLCQFLKKFPACRPPSISLHSFTGFLTQLRQVKSAFGGNTDVFLGISKKLSGRLPMEKLQRLILDMSDHQILIESDDESPNEGYIDDLEHIIEVISKCKNWEQSRTIAQIHSNFLEFICPK